MARQNRITCLGRTSACSRVWPCEISANPRIGCGCLTGNRWRDIWRVSKCWAVGLDALSDWPTVESPCLGEFRDGELFGFNHFDWLRLNARISCGWSKGLRAPICGFEPDAVHKFFFLAGARVVVIGVGGLGSDHLCTRRGGEEVRLASSKDAVVHRCRYAFGHGGTVPAKTVGETHVWRVWQNAPSIFPAVNLYMRWVQAHVPVV